MTARYAFHLTCSMLIHSMLLIVQSRNDLSALDSALLPFQLLFK